MMNFKNNLQNKFLVFLQKLKDKEIIKMKSKELIDQLIFLNLEMKNSNNKMINFKMNVINNNKKIYNL